MSLPTLFFKFSHFLKHFSSRYTKKYIYKKRFEQFLSFFFKSQIWLNQLLHDHHLWLLIQKLENYYIHFYFLFFYFYLNLFFNLKGYRLLRWNLGDLAMDEPQLSHISFPQGMVHWWCNPNCSELAPSSASCKMYEKFTFSLSSYSVANHNGKLCNFSNHPHASLPSVYFTSKVLPNFKQKKYDFLTLYKGFSMEKMIQIS